MFHDIVYLGDLLDNTTLCFNSTQPYDFAKPWEGRIIIDESGHAQGRRDKVL